MDVDTLMSKQVVTMQPHHTVEQARRLLSEHELTAIPVVGDRSEPLGIVSATDLAADLDSSARVSDVMTSEVYVIEPTCAAETAAQVMRNQHIHRLVVMKDKKVAGILSSFDLLKLVSG